MTGEHAVMTPGCAAGAIPFIGDSITARDKQLAELQEQNRKLQQENIRLASELRRLKAKQHV